MKHVSSVGSVQMLGRPFTGAWIETPWILPIASSTRGRPFTGAWIETACYDTLKKGTRSPLHGGVD